MKIYCTPKPSMTENTSIQDYKYIQSIAMSAIIRGRARTLNKIITSNLLRVKMRRPLHWIRRRQSPRTRSPSTVHFPPPLHVNILQPNQRILIAVVPRIGLGVGVSNYFCRHARHLVGAIDTSWRTAVRIPAVRGFLGAFLAVEAVVAFAIRAMAF